MKIGDVVVRKSYGKDITFKIIDIKEEKGCNIYILKGINLRLIADSTIEDLEHVEKESLTKDEIIFNKKVNESIKGILTNRGGFRQAGTVKEYSITNFASHDSKNELAFGRPGKVLHVDGDPEYLDVCLKVYKQLLLDVVGKNIAEKDQPVKVVELVKEIKPDIIVITGHDSIAKGATDYMNLDNYKNSRYFVNAVSELRNYEPNYDDLVIFAGACQSCYEKILDSGANFASSPSRVLIHCLDPVFLCEKIAYTNIEKVVSIQEAIRNTITRTNGIGGLQTRGKYREGFPKSPYV
ncbi:sporulation peptidase YabG [Clostridium luticellarii]|jgi:spore coat assembly protein|uniref:Sporulation-specific protease YabG n=1 Tax=Clostridium luticellarii TaxID=1691940 RepID=A0A2T0BK47_9CLOT|nr:sporulation peptidase YabG [Clostridium luticellarii]MCI1944947.1 sporulation peptidase YabG [Clostridium luticellarii]MCI1968377.1 sporulation peptidase YabG [Clostridium luticellarii]MCI1995375.1 sporulation peptidase YabG [Clostridium luticellarii]MCI2039438.1 sporulation peptidase YabG [Clostridium luticellarii]PRR84251.1 Sporulation-specific protease YabG [Clostridium luticellarii]